MPQQPYTWQPSDVYTITNTTDENVLLELESGRLRIDAGRSVRMTGNALQHPQVMELSRAGKLQIEKFNWRKRKDVKR
ncbi:MAG: hypothetical protein BWY52_02106 [Chloroflexi bacterium ADurb.Bin325]|nr:MAG: hypothetical protein BWY52_02106 [Chloroflexi bacterium ADurb.Bin325]